MAGENCPWDGYGGTRWDCLPEPEPIDWDNLPVLSTEQPPQTQEPIEEEQ